MCRDITRDQQIEGWRAFVELLSGFKPGFKAGFKPRGVGVVAAALAARLHRYVYAAGGRRVPDRAARVLLTVIERDPEAVERTLAG